MLVILPTVVMLVGKNLQYFNYICVCFELKCDQYFKGLHFESVQETILAIKIIITINMLNI